MSLLLILSLTTLALAIPCVYILLRRYFRRPKLPTDLGQDLAEPDGGVDYTTVGEVL